MDRIRPLGPAELRGDAFRHLLWLAAELDDDELSRIAREELPALTVLGAREEGRVVAFAAFDERTRPVTIEYIAVDEGAQSRGWGTALVHAVRERAGERGVRAETDDDAVGFYRRLGFEIVAAEADPRWPGRARYDCVLGQRP
ncbi:GNAT family N-acetyltransferase [Microbacterium sp. Marseille-Q6965]|uniref:GNAT family N-acetyltransferase n=1 Tax=Microbacterium sp. Marseille-Q6965 TaxID=2965072 RepID=UPI0021B75EBB|nr:GNAT family N-acetyltransferase [Microbacterium sp. Marseille-Q6965]